jgi:hypothetical protein
MSYLMVATFALVATGSQVHAQASFEGVATFVTRDKQGSRPDTIRQTTRGKSVRMDDLNRTGKSGGGLIIDGEKKRFIILDANDKTAMIMSQGDQDTMREGAKELAANLPKPRRSATEASDDDVGMQITRTGRTETVAGVRCEVYRGVSNDKKEKNEGEICVADGVGFAMLSAIASNPMFQQTRDKTFDQFRKVLSDGRGIVKATTSENGKSYVSLELIRLEKQKVPDSAFEPPVGYQVRSMGDLLQGVTDAIKKAKAGKPPR